MKGKLIQISVILLFIGLWSWVLCENEIEIKATFYADPSILISKNGDWAYPTERRVYDQATPCLVSRKKIERFIPDKREREYKELDGVWAVYIGEAGSGIAYGHSAEQYINEPKEIAFDSKKKALYRIQPGTIQKIKILFEAQCMREKS